MIAELCTKHPVDAVIVLLLLALFMVSLGTAGKKLIPGFVKKTLGLEEGVTVNVGVDGSYLGPERRKLPHYGHPDECSEHAMIKQFILDSKGDRQRLWEFMGNIHTTQQEMKGKLDLLLQGARVRWNSDLIPPDR